MLVEHGIRFPEGRRRLEDHLFVVHAYFHANGISVLADRPYYHWTTRERSPNASHRPLDPEGYYGNVREVLDLVLEHTEPGPFRDRLLTHWYRGKMLQRVGGAQVHAPRRGPQPRISSRRSGRSRSSATTSTSTTGSRSTCACARRCCGAAATRT